MTNTYKAKVNGLFAMIYIPCLAILPSIDPVNNMSVPHVRYPTPERFATFQPTLNHYKIQVQGKDIGGGKKGDNI